jgi:hypothetical protein
MIAESLINAANIGDWASVSTILYDHWTVNAAECFNVKEKDPWETQFDEKKIGKLLILFL